jgi:hypothetical protein
VKREREGREGKTMKNELKGWEGEDVEREVGI